MLCKADHWRRMRGVAVNLDVVLLGKGDSE